MNAEELADLPVHLKPLLDVGHDNIKEGFHLAPYGDSNVSNCNEC